MQEFQQFVNEKMKPVVKEKVYHDIPQGFTKYVQIAYWAKFFDVSTNKVLLRLLGAIFPFRKGSIFQERYFEPTMTDEPLIGDDLEMEREAEREASKELAKIPNSLRRERKFDLWGPLWIMITLIVASFVCGHFAQDVEIFFGFKPDKEIIKVKMATFWILFYSSAVPLFLYLFLKFVGNHTI